MRFRINVELIEGNTFPVNFRVKILHMLKVGNGDGKDKNRSYELKFCIC